MMFSGLRSRLTLLVLCGLAASSVAAGEQPTTQAPPAHKLADAIARAMSEWLPDQLEQLHVPGAASAVVSQDEIIWEDVFGFVDGSDSPRIGFDTIFCIRSISKSVTALGVLVAVQDGLVDLDVPISNYLPEFAINTRFDEHPEDVITLRHMLSHWAGFTHDPPVGIDVGRPGYFERYVDRISDSWLKTPVGYKHHYSNYGYDLAGYILQSLSGQPFAGYMKEKILDPIGMKNSSFNLELVARRDDRALGHLSDGTVVPVPFPEVAAAGLYASIRDMSKYVQFQLNGGFVEGRPLIREDLMEQYHSIQYAHRDQRTGYCFGLWHEVVSNTVSFYHEGGGRGFGSHLIFYPELGVGVVTLTNKEYHGATGYRGRAVMNGPIINTFGPLLVADAGLNRMQQLELDDSRVQSILGRYGDSPGVVVGFEGGVLGLRMNANRFVPMTFYDDGGELVGMYGSTSEARFLSRLGNKPGAMMTIIRSHSNSNSHYLSFNDSPQDSPGPDRPEWQQYVGEYDVLWEDNPASTATIEIRNGHLYFRDGKCQELGPGVFVHYDGEVVDLRAPPLTYANQEIRKKQ